MDIRRVSEQVKRNCNIGDARSWGYYSVCGLLLRMRELYRQESALAPWQPVGNEALSWVAQRESLWQTLQDSELVGIDIGPVQFDPLDVAGINRALNGHGFVYGGGYGLFLEPTFFLARLIGLGHVEQYRVYYAGEELVRGISAAPAMLQGKEIFIRYEPLEAVLWDRYQQLRGRKQPCQLREAFAPFGIDAAEESFDTLQKKMRTMSLAAGELLVRHEHAEAVEDGGGHAWLGVLGGCSDKLVEVYLRGIKDVVADNSEVGPVKWIVLQRDFASLGLYMALLDGVRKELCPEISAAFNAFVEKSDWSLIDEARESCYRRGKDLTGRIVALWNSTEDPVAVRSFIMGHVRPRSG
ncbi:MAG: Sfum_1244 family protein [Thermodesulfovibrionales bacterium]